MSTNKTLFQEAIADAKAVREAALANAKAALEETMTPRLQSMLAARLEENYEETTDEGYNTEDENNMEENLDLSEILAELENESQLEEAKKEKTDDEGDDEITEVPKDVDEFVEFVTDLIHQEMEKMKEKSSEEPSIVSSEEPSGDEMPEEPSEEEMPEEPSEEEMPEEEEDKEKMDEEFNLEELLAELDGMYEEDGEENMKKESFMDTMRDAGKNISKQVFLIGKISADKVKDGRKVPTSRQEREADWDATSGDRKALEKLGYVFSKTWKDDKEMTMSQSDRQGALAEREMNEAIRTIKTLRSELNEVNLLNAKLIYVNKIFKSKSLTEAQKIQVITSFDKATTTREAKVVFESLTTALAATKKPIKESLGFASRAAGIAPGKQQIIESNDAVARMQKLANIIK
jgi:hypothetical protein